MQFHIIGYMAKLHKKCLWNVVFARIWHGLLFIGAIPGPFLFDFRSFQQILQKLKTADICGIQTKIIRLEGERANHLTTKYHIDLIF